MRLFKTTAICFLLALFLTSCIRALVLNITNNTGQPIKIYSYDTKTNATEYNVGQSLSLDVRFPSELKIVSGQNQWRYKLDGLHPVSGFQHARTLGPIEIKLQIERDGSIYILPPKTVTPTSQLATQPDGFPLKPE